MLVKEAQKPPPNTWNAAVIISVLSLLYNLHLHHALHCMTSEVTRIRGVTLDFSDGSLDFSDVSEFHWLQSVQTCF